MAETKKLASVPETILKKRKLRATIRERAVLAASKAKAVSFSFSLHLIWKHILTYLLSDPQSSQLRDLQACRKIHY